MSDEKTEKLHGANRGMVSKIKQSVVFPSSLDDFSFSKVTEFSLIIASEAL